MLLSAWEIVRAETATGPIAPNIDRMLAFTSIVGGAEDSRGCGCLTQLVDRSRQFDVFRRARPAARFRGGPSDDRRRSGLDRPRMIRESGKAFTRPGADRFSGGSGGGSRVDLGPE
jgi:hypothetical protein